MKPFNPKKKIEDADDYIMYATDTFDAFLMTFTHDNGLLRDVTEDDYVDENEDVLYTDRAMRLAEKMKKLLVRIGEAHFPNSDVEIEIESDYYREY